MSDLSIQKTRYSDVELAMFKGIILNKLAAARTELSDLHEQMRAFHDTPEEKGLGLEGGSATLEKEYLNQLAYRQGQYIQHLENALVRIENKTYGICRITGKLISEARLRAVPHTTMSIEAKRLAR